MVRCLLSSTTFILQQFEPLNNISSAVFVSLRNFYILGVFLYVQNLFCRDLLYLALCKLFFKKELEKFCINSSGPISE